MGLFSTIGSFFGPWGTAIGAGADYLVADNKEDKDRSGQQHTQQLNFEHQMAINRENQAFQREANEQNLAAQREFAQKGIQWKAQDASAAGLHPLAVIGGTGTSFSPSFQAGTSAAYRREHPVARQLTEDMGQNVARAERAGLTEYEREIQGLAIRRGQLENALLEGQISQLWASVMGQPDQPAVPGQSVATGSAARHAVGSVDYQPSPQESHAVGDRGRSAGDSPGFRRQHISNQTAVDLPNSELAEILEGMGAAGHVVGPVLMAKRDFDRRWHGYDKPTTPLPKGYTWQWSKLKQSWVAEPPKQPSRAPVLRSSRPFTGRASDRSY